MKYIDALKKAMSAPAIPNCAMTRTEIETAITELTKRLCGPMSNGERLLLVEDRAELRATLAELSRQEKSA